MKIAPIQGDFLVKLALGAAAIGALYYLVQQAKSSASNAINDAAAWAANVASHQLNPASDQNLAYQGANAALSGAVGREETVGGWLYSATHPDPVTATPAPALDTSTTFGSVGGFYSQPGALY